MKLFLGFDFYGAGNIGDDLAIGCFLDLDTISNSSQLE